MFYTHDKRVKHAFVGDKRVHMQSYRCLSPGLNMFIPGVQMVYTSSFNSRAAGLRYPTDMVEPISI